LARNNQCDKLKIIVEKTVGGSLEMRDGEEVRDNNELQADRRKFLADAGRFAVTVPPAMVLLLSTTMSSPAIAQSGIGRRRGGDDNDQGDDNDNQ
jgi:hypothetical protein